MRRSFRHREPIVAIGTLLRRCGWNRPDVSVVVPIYNKAGFLAQCLDSIAGQTFTNFEAICVDDGSVDESASIARAFAVKDRRFRFCQSTERQGAGSARNIGIMLASGDYLQFVDADDVLPPDALETLYTLVRSGPVEAARGAVAVFERNDTTDIVHREIPPEARGYRVADEPRLWNPWWHTTYLISRALLRRHRIRYPNLADGEDPVFIASVLAAADVVSSTAKIVYLYRAFGDKPRTAVWDTLAHLDMVRRIYVEYEPKCWFEGYGRFMTQEEMPRRLQQLNLDPEQRELIRARLDDLMRPDGAVKQSDRSPA